MARRSILSRSAALAIIAATPVLALATDPTRGEGPSDTKPIMHTLRALNTHPSAPPFSSERKLWEKPVQAKRTAGSFVSAAGRTEPYWGEKPIVRTLRAL